MCWPQAHSRPCLADDQGRVDGCRAPECVHHRGPGDRVVMDLLECLVVGVCGQGYLAADRPEAKQFPARGVADSPDSLDVDVTLHLDLDLGEGHAKMCRIG